MAKIRANILGILFCLFIFIGLITIVPPWLLFCMIFWKRQKLMLIAKPFFTVIFFLFGIKVKVEGNLSEQSKACFMLSNHQSFIDVPIIMLKIFPCAFLAKKSLFKIPYFGQILACTNSISVERGNSLTNADLSKKIQSRLSNNFPIAAFPEGTRSENGELLPFKNGIFRIIKEANASVFPVTIIDAWKVMPRSGIALYPGEIRITIHEIITAKEIESLTYLQLKEAVVQRIAKPIQSKPILKTSSATSY